MWKLKFPLFTLKLIGKLGLTFGQLIFFPLEITRLMVVNLLLTVCLIALGAGLIWLPNAQPQHAVKLNISLENSQEIVPVYRTIKNEQLSEVFQTYRTETLKKNFIPQADYINLAILAHEAQQYEEANKYLQLARFINPNRDFFID
ncbi:MAG: hypothetical protein A2383_00450 [Candidatus Pacebacteria bacterium RIFOXYB1_FULL_39_46]|nr:MAG: hypothetical protein A2182_00280 [Candidatus Pacebacteria bacterium RIFOXYA1_FULL_38_18]OGJ38058.1 MAG: hypothetical protein A2383_00450 [Candidatus Pacebacteria bacterium RIFOXYB1_FULL_39_46]OGJ39719.1 MAG: hypothetical protein A2411_02995 [Candidatus Pacebacteria bacterium RIFOXYC1_FULL_39_21]OGJ39810.1 MAG: hypothetical protein A2582_00215 [Candidatus Pacebacteria bacterium RIFOXYD1_FULL_39_27]